MIESWIAITILACFFQNLRSLFQKKLQGRLSDLGATYTRFGYGLPFVLLYFLLLVYFFKLSLPALNVTFLFYCFVGSISQILATYLLLKTFLLKNFAIANAYSKTEPIQAIFMSIIILNEQVSLIGFFAILISVIGVLLISFERRAKFNFNLVTFIGIFSGTLFGVSAVCFRAASLNLDHDFQLINSTYTLVIAILVQTIFLTIYLFLKDSRQIILSIKNVKHSLVVGFTGASASMCWFYCMAIQNVAYVRAVGQIELFFSLLISYFYLREKIKLNEMIGLFVMIFGLILIFLFV